MKKRKKKYPPAKNTPAKMRSNLNAHLERLTALVTDAEKSAAMESFLKCQARFHAYSFNNQLMILITRPNATHVAGYTTWKKLKRQVMRGEKGIPIYAPHTIQKLDEDNKPERGFHITCVYDISQTEGEPLPEAPQWKSPEKRAQLEEALKRFATSRGIEVETRDLEGETQGESKNGNILMDPAAGTSTLIHEVAHELLHHATRQTREAEELEAESIAFVVCAHFNMDDNASPNYLALWDADAEKIKARAKTITSTAKTIITAIEKELTNG